jgi:hypothetical protein
VIWALLSAFLFGIAAGAFIWIPLVIRHYTRREEERVVEEFQRKLREEVGR